MRGGEVDDDAGGGVDAAVACADSGFWLVLQVDAEDVHDAVDDVVADGDEAGGDIRISGMETT